MIKPFLFSLAVFSAMGVSAKAQDSASAIGFWITQNKDGVVQIAPCDSGLCGYLIGLRPGQPPQDYPKDIHNSDPARRGDSLCGLMLMGSLKPVDGQPSKWEDGWVYDPQSGSTYSVTIALDGADKLKLRGYLGVSLFGRTETWTREGENKNRCIMPDKTG